ncbi:hypothetical protein PV327_008348 [Microctonus hyperodae]|uniref:VPS9 domain-containing protein n=1 Tax=Microctonus hyperodae TaxID=165561 RepID=A0AA39F2Y1_MICHY|nr:hypothetical protein PV327_008348 [Microctonus hyperodae]
MEANYDENLSKNPFLQTLLNQDYVEIFKKVVENKWIICVPRQGSFKNDLSINEKDLSNHILIANEDENDKSSFHTLTGTNITFKNRILNITFKDDVDNKVRTITARFLFEETFYTDNSSKYTVWCIERPLSASSLTLDTDVVNVLNIGDCMSFLLSEIEDADIFRDVDTTIKAFETLHQNIEKESISIQKELVQKLYLECLQKILNISKIQEKTNASAHYFRTIKIAVESYLLFSLRKLLPAAVSSKTYIEDAKLNKIVKNLYELDLEDLDIKYDIHAGITRGKLELSRLDNFVTVLGKVGCIKQAIRYISDGLKTLSTDDLLPILIFIVIRTGLPNWIAQLTFIKQFRFSSDVMNEADETEFLVASLEAAVEHVRSGVLTKANLRIPVLNSLEKHEEIIIPTLDELFTAIQKCNLEEVERILNEQQLSNEFSNKSTLQSTKFCHPLCRCEKCERNFMENQLSQTNWPSVNSKDENGRTALHIASIHGHVTIVDFLLIHHANPNEIDTDGCTPLHYSTSRGHQNTVLLLLHANANPTIVDNRGNSPLHLAADHGHETCAKALLYFSEQMNIAINTNCVNNVGDTPLHYAAKWGYISIVEILLDHKANVRIANRRGQTPLTVAHSSHVSRLLEKYPDIDNNVLRVPCSHSHDEKQMIVRQNKNVKSEIIYNKADKLLAAINEGDIRLACYYLGLEGPHAKPEVNDTPNLCHPLCACDKCASTDEVFHEENRAIALGLNISNAQGKTALHVASANGLVELVEILLDAGANVNARTIDEHRTPLHLACINSKIKVIKILLRCRTSNINAKDFCGDTPLHLAVRNGDFQVVELLLRHCVDVSCRNIKGATALEEINEIMKNKCSSKIYENIIKILKSHVAINNTSQLKIF